MRVNVYGVYHDLESSSDGILYVLNLITEIVANNYSDSVILIDNIEQYLDSSTQQALIKLLPILGKNNQFIITTHSEDVAAMIDRNKIIYL